jgi:Skp family chaperone for outer membrane proteins
MIRRGTWKVIFLTLTIVALASIGLAQQAVKIGVVNSQEVLEKSSEGKKVMNQLQDKDKKNQAELSRRDEEIRQLQTKLSTQRLTLTQEALMNISSDLEKKQTDRKRFAEDTYREMQELTQRFFQRIQAELLPIIEQIGTEKGLDIIFDLRNSGAVYYNPAVDITQEVITRYDASKASKR